MQTSIPVALIPEMCRVILVELFDDRTLSKILIVAATLLAF